MYEFPLFGDEIIRRVWHDDEWWFDIEEVILTFIDTEDIKSYIKTLRLTDEGLDKRYNEIVRVLNVITGDGIERVDCANIEGIFRVIQSINSSKVEPFKCWMAKLGRERIDELSKPD